MADLAAADITLTKVRHDIVGRVHEAKYRVAYGDGALTYPAGGVPLPALASFGMHEVEDFELKPITIDGYVYKYDLTNHTIRKFQSGGFTPAGTVAAPVFTGNALAVHDHDLKILGGQAPEGATSVLNSKTAGGPLLGKEEAGDETIVGADAATKGGIVGIAAGTPAGTNSAPAFTGAAVNPAALSEVPGTHAPAATVLLLTLRGK